jgi:hypothetical protein
LIVDGTHHLKLGLNQTGGGGHFSTWCRRGIVQREGAVLRPDKIPVMGHLIPVSGSKIPCSFGEGISREKPAAQGVLRFCATSRPLIREEFPVNFPDTNRENKDSGD